MQKIVALSAVMLLSLAGLIVTLSAAAPAVAAPAAVFNVNSFGDAVDASINGTCDTGGGVCTLRAAIMEANHLSGSVINVPSGTYLLTLSPSGGDPDSNGNLNIITSMSIIGAGSASTFVDGSGIVPGDNVFFVSSNSAVVVISGLTIQHGANTLRNGGGIGNDGKLTMTDTVVLENGTESFLGGGIYNSNNGFLALINSTVQGNSASGVGINLQGCGGIYNNGVLTVTNSTIVSNTSGGANATGGGLCNARALSMNRSAVVGNHVTGTNGLGGGLYNFNAVGAVSLINSTFSGNRSDGSGGGIANAVAGNATLYNVTVANNVADADLAGGGSGGGIFGAGTGAINLRNTLLGRNSGLADCTGPCTHLPDDCRGGAITSQDYNLIQTTTGCAISGPTTHNVGGDPLLAALALNGGQTLNHALNGGSPAIDAGNVGGCLDNLGASITVDQRGAPRPIGPRCDVGAYESNLVAPAVVAISGPNGGLVNTAYVYTATVSPLTATQPITFVWQATGQLPVTHTVSAISDSMTYQWNTAGSQLISVTASNTAGDAQSSYGVTIGNPLPTLSAISPTVALAGGPTFTLTVTGTNFVPGSVVRWNGSDRATTYISATKLQAVIPAADIAAFGAASVTVFNATPGGGESNALSFAIRSVLYLPLILR